VLLPRILTAAVGIPLLLYVIELGGVPFAALVVGLAVLALHEYAMVLWMGGRGVQRLWTVLGGGLMAASVAAAGQSFPGRGLLGMSLAVVVTAAVLSEVFRKEHSLDRASLTVFGAVFIGWTLGHLVLIRELVPHGKSLTYLLFASVWTTDSAAYFTGRAVGRHKLAEVISPKKTWEGAVGGLAGALAAVFIAQRFFLQDALNPLTAGALGLLIGVVGQISDLAQSLVKRAAGTKDSAALLPGHGGIFDRMDSFLFLAPLYYYLTLLL